MQAFYEIEMINYKELYVLRGKSCCILDLLSYSSNFSLFFTYTKPPVEPYWDKHTRYIIRLVKRSFV